MFWDSSALIPCFVREERSEEIVDLFSGDEAPIVWWTARVECISAIERRRREGIFTPEAVEAARRRLEEVLQEAAVVQPHPLVLERAERLLAVHLLRAADALQLGAALVACDEQPRGEGFACLDERLREAARREGFTVRPG
jgi:predicted nucleic acid-binding protein